MRFSILGEVLENLGAQSVKIVSRGRGTAITERDFIAAVAPEYLNRPALMGQAPQGETVVLVQATDSEQWTIYAVFVTLPF